MKIISDIAAIELFGQSEIDRFENRRLPSLIVSHKNIESLTEVKVSFLQPLEVTYHDTINSHGSLGFSQVPSAFGNPVRLFCLRCP